MDPSKPPTDTDIANEGQSLEGGGSVVEAPQSASLTSENGANPIGDTSLSSEPTSAGSSPEPSQRPPFFKRIWQNFNIYLLLFFVLILLAAGVIVVLVLKDRSTTKSQNKIGSQELSQAALKDLANSNVTVGNSKQVLNIESNAVFAGTVLVRSNLDIAGTLRIGGDLALPGITVSGSSKFGQMQAESLNISGVTNMQGALTLRQGLNVNGNSTFAGTISAAQVTTNSLQLNGDLTLTKHVVAGGPIPALANGNALGAGGTASVSGSDVGGSITINTGSGPAAGCFATLTFVKAYTNTPHVLVTPVGSGAGGLGFYVNRSTTTFSVCTTTPAAGGQTFGFDYMILN